MVEPLLDASFGVSPYWPVVYASGSFADRLLEAGAGKPGPTPAAGSQPRKEEEQKEHPSLAHAIKAAIDNHRARRAAAESGTIEVPEWHTELFGFIRELQAYPELAKWTDQTHGKAKSFTRVSNTLATMVPK